MEGEPPRVFRRACYVSAASSTGLAGVEQRQDVRILQVGGRRDFLNESLCPEDGGEFGAQHLHRHLAMVFQVLGEVNRGHATRAEFTLDGIGISEGRR